MALEVALSQRPLSPASSGRSSPVPRALPRREDGQRYDKSFRKYASAVERTLASFDTAQQEWADYISFLGRLLKVLQSYPPEPRIIPHSNTVATRLAQCLNPGLPSGVHQKALEVYAHIFATLGSDALATDLQVYFSGLSSVLSFASLSVRPLFLSIIETYFVPLVAEALRPALKAVILSLLPGLEDESSEDFDRILNLLDRFRESTTGFQALGPEKDSVGTDSYFWQCLFLATITNPSRRQGALAYLSRRLPRISSDLSLASSERQGSLADLPPEHQALVTPEPGLLVRCFAAGLSDQQLLIQRGFLDLLVTHLPLASTILQNTVQAEDLQRLVIAAASVVNRKDMSLNRRLWAWFLGPEPKPGSGATPTEESQSPFGDVSSYQAAHFSRFGAHPLAASLLRLIRSSGTSTSERARPFRICLSLMDRWEVGGLMVPEIFVPALQSVFTYSFTANKEQTDEVIRSASLFFDGVESGLIWSKLFDLATSAFANDQTPHEDQIRNLHLYLFIITRFNIREEEMITHHIPLSLLGILSMMWRLRSLSKSARHGKANSVILNYAFQICDALVRLIPDRAFAEAQASDQVGASSTLDSTGFVDISKIDSAIRRFYEAQSAGADTDQMPFSPQSIGRSAVSLAIQHAQHSLSRQSQIDQSVRLLNELMHKVPRSGSIVKKLGLLDALRSSQTPAAKGVLVPFPVVSAATTVTAAFRTSLLSSDLDNQDLSSLVTVLVQSLWLHLGPQDPKYHVEAVRCLWILETISAPTRRVESALSSLIHSSSGSDPGRRFAVIWNHTIQERTGSGMRGRRSITRRVSGMPGLPSGVAATITYEAMLTRPLLAILDSLSEDESELSAYTSAWLQDLSSLSMVFSILCSAICRLTCITSSQRMTVDVQNDTSRTPMSDDSNECIYFLHHVENILRRGGDHTWMTLAGESIPGLEKDEDGIARSTVLQKLLAQICMHAFDTCSRVSGLQLQRVSLSVIHMILRNPFAAPLKELELEKSLLERLHRNLSDMSPLLQSAMLHAITAALHLQHTSSFVPPPTPTIPPPSAVPLESPPHHRRYSRETRAGPPHLPDIAEKEKETNVNGSKTSPQLVACFRDGLATASSRMALDSWIDFFEQVMPLFADSIFQTVLSLVDTFCAQVLAVFTQLQSIYEASAKPDPASESSLISLLNGLEYLLAQAHQRLVDEESINPQARSPDQPQGFFANMVPGVFSSEVQQISRSTSANNRLTVLLCFQDTVRICFKMWTWGAKGIRQEQDPTSMASFGYTSLRIRNRARRLLEHLFEMEALECLETLCVLWCRPPDPTTHRPSIVSLLNVLNGSKPKKTMPAIFDSLYSRTSPSALETKQLSTLTSDLSDTEIMWFLLEYTRSLEDDSMDEIWTDCITFLKDVLGNPMPQRQVLPALLEFTTILAEKIENTNFGEERKMRRELGELFLRLLTAIFTTRPVGFVQEFATKTPRAPDTSPDGMPPRLTDVVAMLSDVTPKLQLVVGESDKIVTAANSIATNVISPALRSKHFPENISKDTSALVQHLSSISQASKSWRKDVSDAFNDGRFFSMPRALVDTYWLRIIFQLNVADKERLSELLSRLTAPATAGIMFGVGATSARQAADRAAQLNLRRVVALILACPEDTFASKTGPISEKVSELLTARPVTSPSSATRAELFMLLRALVLKISAIHLAPLWPIISVELGAALASALPGAEDSDRYDGRSLLQACKLLDVLVTVGPDDFQLYEWLFVTDTIDAVYRPPEWTSAALVDEIAEVMGATAPAGGDEALAAVSSHGTGAEGLRVPFLDPLVAASKLDVRNARREDVVARIVRPFFGQLSISAFEATYGMQVADLEACRQSLLADLFDESEAPA